MLEDMYYILEGREFRKAKDMWECENQLRAKNARDVGKTRVGNIEVSTVFLCIDHSHSINGPPVLFETMIFGGEHDQYQDRYCTYDEAEAGHARVVANLTAGLHPDENHPDAQTNQEAEWEDDGNHGGSTHQD